MSIDAKMKNLGYQKPFNHIKKMHMNVAIRRRIACSSIFFVPRGRGCIKQGLMHVELVRSVSHVKDKLGHFIKTGEVLTYSDEQYHRKSLRQNFKAATQAQAGSYSLQKALLVLKYKYGHILDDIQKSANISEIKASDLRVDSEISAIIFKSLMGADKLTKKLMDRKLRCTLLGTNELQIKDKFVVTREALKLLSRDKDAIRAMSLIKLANPETATAAMNSIHAFHLSHGDIKSAFKSLLTRKKWGIPETGHTYTIFFDGLAKSHEWGKVSHETAEKCINIYERLQENSTGDMKRSLKANRPLLDISHFNSCLSVLVKNFKNNQEYAWSFFDFLLSDKEMKSITPNSYTFTILLNGIKKYINHIHEEISEDRKISKNFKVVHYLKCHSQLVQTAQMIYKKLLTHCMPPVPPTKEEAKSNPRILEAYKEKIKKPLSDIDETFAGVFLSCFINRMRPLSSFSSMLHYLYIQEGLQYLRFWAPEINDLLIDTNSDIKIAGDIVAPTKAIFSTTNAAVNNAIASKEENPPGIELEAEATSLLPSHIVSPSDLKIEEINPLVIFPPPLLSHNKSKALFSNKQKRLVDFKRPTFHEVSLIYLDKQYRNSGGKFGKKLSSSRVVSLDKREGINKYLLMLYLEGISGLGKHEAFYLSVLHSLRKWGGITISRQEIDETSFQATNVARFTPSFRFSDSFAKMELLYESNLLPEVQNTPPHNPDVVDIKLVEKIIYALFDGFKDKQGLICATEVFLLLSNSNRNSKGGLRPNQGLIDALFAVFTKQLHYFNDVNHNSLMIEYRKKNLLNNPPKYSISRDQMKFFLTNLQKIMNCVLLMVPNENFTFSRDSIFKSYNRIVSRLYQSAWLDTSPSDNVELHRMILRTGLLTLRMPREDHDLHTNNVIQSLDYLLKALKDRDTLEDTKKQIIDCLASISENKSHSSKEWLQLIRKCYSLLH